MHVESELLKKSCIEHSHAKTPPAVQSTPVCRLQGNGGGGGGGGLLIEDEDTDEEEDEEGSFARGALE